MTAFFKRHPTHSDAPGSQKLTAKALDEIRKECVCLLDEYCLQKRRIMEIESPKIPGRMKFPGRMRNGFLLFGGNIAQIFLCNGGLGKGRVSVKEMGEALNLVFEKGRGTEGIAGKITVTFDGFYCGAGKIEPASDAISGEVARILMNMLA